MTEQDTERVSPEWDAESEPKKKRPGILGNFRVQSVSGTDTGEKKTRGRARKGYVLNVTTAKSVLHRVFDTVGRATGYVEIWRLTPEEADRLAGSSVVLFNSLPEKMRTPAGENGTKLAILIAAAEFGFATRDIVIPRIAVMQMSKAAEKDTTDYESMSFPDLMDAMITPFPKDA